MTHLLGMHRSLDDPPANPQSILVDLPVHYDLPVHKPYKSHAFLLSRESDHLIASEIKQSFSALVLCQVVRL
jgi:hypothetical protein